MSEVKIIIPMASLQLAERVKKFPFLTLRAIAKGMDTATEKTVLNIKEKRLSGPTTESSLTPRSNLMRESASRLYAEIQGNRVTTHIIDAAPYAWVHEEGKVIERVTKPGVVRLRTDRAGNLVRQENHPQLARFAKKTGKLAREVSHPGGKTYKIVIPARAPFGHGIADNETTYTACIGAEVEAAWEGKEL